MSHNAADPMKPDSSDIGDDVPAQAFTSERGAEDSVEVRKNARRERRTIDVVFEGSWTRGV